MLEYIEVHPTPCIDCGIEKYPPEFIRKSKGVFSKRCKSCQKLKQKPSENDILTKTSPCIAKGFKRSRSKKSV